MSSLLQAIDKMDRKLFIALNQTQSGYMNRIIHLITRMGDLASQAVLVIALLLPQATRSLGIKLAVIQIIVTIVIQLLKAAVARVRPYNALPGIKVAKAEKDYSFPSGHTAASFTTAITISAFFPALSLVCLSLAAFIGYSRVYIGVHYPSDVVAGSVIGGLTTVLMLLLI